MEGTESKKPLRVRAKSSKVVPDRGTPEPAPAAPAAPEPPVPATQAPQVEMPAKAVSEEKSSAKISSALRATAGEPAPAPASPVAAAAAAAAALGKNSKWRTAKSKLRHIFLLQPVSEDQKVSRSFGRDSAMRKRREKKEKAHHQNEVIPKHLRGDWEKISPCE